MKRRIISLFIIFAMLISFVPSNNVCAATGYVEYTSARGTGIPSKQSVSSNSYFYVSSRIPTCTGYTFQYWKSYGGTIYYPGEYAYLPGSSLLLYAVWEAETYTIRYDENGGYYAPDEQEKTYGKSLKLTTEEPERYGYIFVGWGTSKNSTTVSYKPGASYTKNASITLYAIWKKSYTITYLANGGTDAPDDQIKTHGTSLKLSTVKPTRKGYTFEGWATNSYATKAKYKAGATYTDNASITLYAVWSCNHIYNEEVINSSTCISTGYKRVVCERCGDNYTEQIPKTKHKYVKSTNKWSGEIIKECSECGDYYVISSSVNKKEDEKNSSDSNSTSKKPAKVKFSLKAGKKKVTIKWNKVKGANGYAIYYKTSKKGAWKKVKNLSAKKTKYVKKKLKKGKTYYFTVKAYTIVNGKKVYGKFKTKKIKVKK